MSTRPFEYPDPFDWRVTQNACGAIRGDSHCMRQKGHTDAHRCGDAMWANQPQPDDLGERYWNPQDIPDDVQRQLMSAAVGNGRISYHWLCDVYRQGRGDGTQQVSEISRQRDELLVALLGLRALIHDLDVQDADDSWNEAVAKADAIVDSLAAKGRG